MIKLFYSYSHKDEVLRDRLETHLSMLKNAGYITSWHDRKIMPGEEWDKRISSAMEEADIILLLISSDFLASRYCYDIEVKSAIEMHNQKKAIVLPIILRFCDWKLSHFEHLQCLPQDARPIVSTYWENEDFAFLNVVEGIKKVVNDIREKKTSESYFPYVSKINFFIGGMEYFIERYILENNTFVGIDFGTSTTAVSVSKWDKQKNNLTFPTITFEFQSDNQGTQRTSLVPSVLFYDSSQKTLLSGYEAKKRRFSQDTIEGVNYWSSFKMGLGKDVGHLFIDSALKNNTEGTQILNPKDATREFLRSIQRRISDFVETEGLSKNLKISVSIPASFEANQRRELLEVIEEIGYQAHENLFIDEPNAAFLNFIQEEFNSKFLNLNIFERQHTLVFDFGAGTCDISILEFGKKNSGFYSRNIAISKFEKLGGDDIDKKIAKDVLFPEFLENHDLDINTISEREYFDLFEPKLKIPAESLKIKISEKLKKLKGKLKKDAFIFCEEAIIFSYKGTEYSYESQSLSFGQYEEIMETFINDDPQNDSSIYFVVNSALTKAHMKFQDIDNVLLIGGSCKNPLIEQSLKSKFPTANFLIPTDLQTQVSKGTAIHALLSIGLNKQPIAPIVSESISILLNSRNFLNVIQQGEEIPHFKSLTEKLAVQRNGQKTIELPLFVSGNDKMLQNVIIKSDKEFTKDDKISISAEIDRNKIVTLSVTCNNKELKAAHFSPFANEVLSPYKRAVKEAEREINNLLSQGHEKNDKEVMDLIDTLIVYHTNMNNFKEAMETTIKYAPNRYSDISYYAACAGYDKIATEYSIKAFNSNPNDTNAYNLALEFEDNPPEYEKYMRIAADLGNISAKIALAADLCDIGNEEGRKLMQEPFDFLFSKYQNNKKQMSIHELDDLTTTLEYLGYVYLMQDVEDTIEKRRGMLLKANVLFKEENLLREV